MRIRSMTSVSSASLPHVEKGDAVSNTDAKERVFQLVKKLFKATATPKQLMEAYDKKSKSAEVKSKKVKQVKELLDNSNVKLEAEIKALNETLDQNIKKLTDAIQGGMPS